MKNSLFSLVAVLALTGSAVADSMVEKKARLKNPVDSLWSKSVLAQLN